MSKRRELIRFEVPLASADVAARRCRPIVQQYTDTAGYGTLDLDGLARSCYLQGVRDGSQLPKPDERD